MTSRDFCYWLQGFFEIGHPISMSPEQVAIIRAHLNMVFHHEIDPSFGKPQHVEELRKIHEGVSPEVLCVTTTPLDPVITGILSGDFDPSKLGGSFNC